MKELQISPERSIRGGPRAARRAVTQLIRLGRSAQACELFLKNRSTLSKYSLRQVKIEGNTALYVKKLCELFFNTMAETCQEFIKAFPDHFGCHAGKWTYCGEQCFICAYHDNFSKYDVISFKCK